MSHYVVVVVGDPDKLAEHLAPFDENVEVEPYRHPVGDWEIEYAVNNGAPAGDWAAIAAKLNDEFSDSGSYLADDEGVYQMSTYNPKSKWDWYVVGGRWDGFWKGWQRFHTGRRVPSTPVNVTRRVDIDWSRMYDEAAEAAGKRWDEVHAVIDAHPVPMTWAQVREAHPVDHQGARDAYNGQAAVNAVKDLGSGHPAWWDGPDEYLRPRADYAHAAGFGAGMPFAFLIDGEWIERGKMRFFGVVEGDTEQDAWHREAHAIYDKIPGAAILTAVDIHI
ncbi:MAG: hypothetical protein IPH08_04065 [Rhodocyclaceae bacterium]|nr:hypothetical protein [Rhodocyclaceae bacterium]